MALLLALIERQISWAEQLATTHWPADAAKQRQLLRLTNGRINQPWLLSKLIELIPNSSLWSLQGISWDAQAAHRQVDVPAWLDAAQYVIQPYAELDRQQIAVLPQSTIGSHLTVGISSTTMRVQKQLVALQSIPFSHSAWAPWVAAARFAADPIPVTMARELRWLAKVWQPTADDLYDYAVAWPFAACVAMAATQTELLALANHVEAGQLGTMEQWIAAEQRWQAHGITESDLFAITDDCWPYPATVDQIGFPCSASLLQRFEGGELDHWDTLYSYYSACPPGRTKAWFAWHLCMLLTYPYWENWKCISTTPESLQQLFEDGCPAVVGCDLFDIIDFPVPLTEDWIACIDWIGTQSFEFHPADEPCDEAQAIAEAFVRDPTRHGLLRVLGFLVIPGSACNISVQILKPTMYQDKQDQLAVCFLRLAQGQWDDTEAGELAQYFVTFAHDSPRILTWVVRTAQNHDLPQAQIDIFALALWNAVCARPTAYAAPALELLQRCMQERLSGWSTSEQRSVQGLPALA